MFLSKNNFFLVLLFVGFNISFAQKEFKFTKIEGCAVIGPNMTFNQAKQKAIEQAKLNALENAGISELITSNQYYIKERGTLADKDKFYENTFSDLKGEITQFNTTQFKQSIGEANEIVVCVIANVNVIKYDEIKSNRIQIDLAGLATRYKDNESLEVTISTNEESFFWLFLIDAQENYQLIYPKSQMQSNKLNNNKLVLPDKNEEVWNLATDLDEEKNSLLLIVNPYNIYLNPDTINDFNSWSNWYQKLNFNRRNKIIKTFTIYK